MATSRKWFWELFPTCLPQTFDDNKENRLKRGQRPPGKTEAILTKPLRKQRTSKPNKNKRFPNVAHGVCKARLGIGKFLFVQLFRTPNDFVCKRKNAVQGTTHQAGPAHRFSENNNLFAIQTLTFEIFFA